MPIYSLSCQACGHHFETLYFKGLKLPDKWVCTSCESEDVVQEGETPHPWEQEHGGGSCPCCF